jgi:hypothetical protein
MTDSAMPKFPASNKPIAQPPDAFEWPHGVACDCDDCLAAWGRYVAARYIDVVGARAIPETDLVLVYRPWTHWGESVQIWKRSDRLAYLKAVAVAKPKQGERLHIDCDARPVLVSR